MVNRMKTPARTIEYLTPEAKHLDQQIRQACKDHGLTLADLAHKAGISPQTLHNIRSGAVAAPREKTREALEDALGWMRGGWEDARQGRTPARRDATANTPIPPGDGFRWTRRPDGIVDYWYTIKIGDAEHTLHVADVHNKGPEAIRAALEKSAIALKAVHSV